MLNLKVTSTRLNNDISYQNFCYQHLYFSVHLSYMHNFSSQLVWLEYFWLGSILANLTMVDLHLPHMTLTGKYLKASLIFVRYCPGTTFFLIYVVYYCGRSSRGGQQFCNLRLYILDILQIVCICLDEASKIS